jgi:hypothetical protein
MARGLGEADRFSAHDGLDVPWFRRHLIQVRVREPANKIAPLSPSQPPPPTQIPEETGNPNTEIPLQ